jgi:hypothetical protein
MDSATGRPGPGQPADTTRQPEVVRIFGIERRKEERVAVQAPVEVHHTGPAQAEIRDISLSGTFVALEGSTISVGAGLRLEFTLPQGFRVIAFGRVAWARPTADASGVAGFGVQFYGLDDINRDFIRYYLDVAKQGGGGAITAGRIDTRYEVLDPTDEQLRLRLSGSLQPLESEGLDEVVCRKLARKRASRLFVFVDAVNLGACPKGALDPMRNWLERLRQGRQVLGVLVGGSTVGVTQIRRLARDAGVADAFMSFADLEEAETFWKSLVAAKPRAERP